VFIEDAPHNVLSMLNVNKQVIMPDQPWNRSMDNIVERESWYAYNQLMYNVIRSRNWKHIRDLVLQLAGEY
jgi:hypothetical protein